MTNSSRVDFWDWLRRDWEPVNGRWPQSVSIAVRFNWREDDEGENFLRCYRNKESRIIDIGPLEIWVEL